MESITANGVHTVGDGNVDQDTASIESVCANVSDTVGDGHGGEITIIEGIFCDSYGSFFKSKMAIDGFVSLIGIGNLACINHAIGLIIKPLRPVEDIAANVRHIVRHVDCF